MTNIAMDNGPCTYVLPIKMVIFHSYVSLPEVYVYMYICIYISIQTGLLQTHQVRLGGTLGQKKGNMTYRPPKVTMIYRQRSCLCLE